MGTRGPCPEKNTQGVGGGGGGGGGGKGMCVRVYIISGAHGTAFPCTVLNDQGQVWL